MRRGGSLTLHGSVFWGNTPLAWDLNGGHKEDGTAVRYSQVKGTTTEGLIQVHFWPLNDDPWRIWKFIPVKVDDGTSRTQPSPGVPGQGPLPPYDGNAGGQSSTRDQRVELEHGEFGTIVNQVTVVTTVTNSTITTHKRYRVEDAPPQVGTSLFASHS